MRHYLILGLLFSVFACQKEETKTPASSVKIKEARAALRARNHSQVQGEVSLEQQNNQVNLKIEISGLKPNSTHGLHIHENGDCTDVEAMSAGGHFNPEGHQHGDLKEEQSHAGDLGNLTADQSGVIKAEVMSDKFSLNEGEKLSVINRSIVIHERADDLESSPSGASGKRIACGVIMEKTEEMMSE